jgi:hypothetical protein
MTRTRRPLAQRYASESKTNASLQSLSTLRPSLASRDHGIRIPSAPPENCSSIEDSGPRTERSSSVCHPIVTRFRARIRRLVEARPANRGSNCVARPSSRREVVQTVSPTALSAATRAWSRAIRPRIAGAPDGQRTSWTGEEPAASLARVAAQLASSLSPSAVDVFGSAV